VDETGQIAHWHIPAAHFLESWSDARAYDGTVSIVQPMIDPLYGGKTAHHDVFQALLDEPAEPVRCGARDVEAGHQGRLRDGLAQGAASGMD
jgi:anaerobic selenocysteine-containing dehydrogenase